MPEKGLLSSPALSFDGCKARPSSMYVLWVKRVAERDVREDSVNFVHGACSEQRRPSVEVWYKLEAYGKLSNGPPLADS